VEGLPQPARDQHWLPLHASDSGRSHGEAPRKYSEGRLCC
jgi:hypothetical protein